MCASMDMLLYQLRKDKDCGLFKRVCDVNMEGREIMILIYVCVFVLLKAGDAAVTRVSAPPTVRDKAAVSQGQCQTQLRPKSAPSDCIKLEVFIYWCREARQASRGGRPQ